MVAGDLGGENLCTKTPTQHTNNYDHAHDSCQITKQHTRTYRETATTFAAALANRFLVEIDATPTDFACSAEAAAATTPPPTARGLVAACEWPALLPAADAFGDRCGVGAWCGWCGSTPAVDAETGGSAASDDFGFVRGAAAALPPPPLPAAAVVVDAGGVYGTGVSATVNAYESLPVGRPSAALPNA